MADSFTPNLNLRKPEVGAAYDTWGGVTGLNADLDLIDAVFLATGLGTSVGLHVGPGKALDIGGEMRVRSQLDATKVLRFDAGGPPGNTCILTSAGADGVIATEAYVQAQVLAKHPVGTILSGYFGAAPVGFIFADGRTIGDASSGASNRADADCERLFKQLWGLGFSVVNPPGRGVSADFDWLSHKQIVLPNHSGRVMAGRDDLSGAAQGIWTGATVRGAVGGAQLTTVGFTSGGTLNVNFGDAPFHFVAGGGTIESNGVPSLQFGGSGVASAINDTVRLDWVSGYTSLNNNFGVSVSGATNNASTIQPTIVVDVIIAL